ncbi:DUF4135 domain-containing protein [Rothia sp. CCM 9416]|uniref:DUF4135 domain-containing protein n=1 Tax=Rothia sp. CCM 9416 TaxID=3402655 RepID=UPI003AE2A748
MSEFEFNNEIVYSSQKAINDLYKIAENYIYLQSGADERIIPFEKYISRKIEILIASFLKSYPHENRNTQDLFSRIDKIYRNSLNFYEELLRNCIKASNTYKLGEVQGFYPAYGDTHNGGKTVSLVNFKGGSYFYKPRNLSIDIAYSESAAALFGYSTEQNILKISDSHGLVKRVPQFIDFSSKKSLSRFYFEYGRVFSFLYLLCASDMHSANIINSQISPIVIDCETLLDPLSKNCKDNLKEMILNIGVIPGSIVERSNQGESVDFSALAFRASPQKSFRPRLYLEDGKLKEEYLDIAPSKNIPYINKKSIPPKFFSSNFVDGCSSVLNNALQNKNQWVETIADNFSNCVSRIVLRDTHIYSSSLVSSLSLTGLESESNRLYRELSRQGNFDERIVFSEIQQIESGDIPYFNAGVDSLDLLGKGIRINNYFNKTGIDVCAERIYELSQKDIEDISSIIIDSFNR